MTRPPRPSPHFTWEEVTVRWSGGVRTPGADLPHLTDRQAAALIRVCRLAEVIRTDVGAPVHVTSGFRHGDKLQHGDGQALDLQVRGMSPLDLIARIRRLHDAGLLPGLRQVIAEARGTGLTGPMDEGSGRWVHIAALGVAGEDWAEPTSRAWLTTSDGKAYSTWSPS